MNQQNENARWKTIFGIMLAVTVSASSGMFCLGLYVGHPQPARIDSQVQTNPGMVFYPTTPADARVLRAYGLQWNNQTVRLHYLRLINDPSPEYVARRAFIIRHNARMTCRAMMTDQREVQSLQARDVEKYGNADGPTFDWLVRKHMGSGLADDQIFDRIQSDSLRTNQGYDRAFGEPITK